MSYSELKKEELINSVFNGTKNFYDLPALLRKDKEFVFKVVKKEPLVIEYLSENLRDDIDIVLEVVKQDGYLLQFASDRLKDNKEILLETIKNYPLGLRYSSTRLQNDIDILEVLEKMDVEKSKSNRYKKWHKGKMEVLAELRRQEDKKLIEESIINSVKTAKKVKF